MDTNPYEDGFNLHSDATRVYPCFTWRARWISATLWARTAGSFPCVTPMKTCRAPCVPLPEKQGVPSTHHAFSTECVHLKTGGFLKDRLTLPCQAVCCRGGFSWPTFCTCVLRTFVSFLPRQMQRRKLGPYGSEMSFPPSHSKGTLDQDGFSASRTEVTWWCFHSELQKANTKSVIYAKMENYFWCKGCLRATWCIFSVFLVLLSDERWSLRKSRILTPEAAVSVVFRCCCWCSEADGHIHLYKREKCFIFYLYF